MKPFQQVQQSMTAFVRDPDACVGPEGIETRRLAIYRDLFFNNIEGFLSNGFPVCRSLFSDDDWHALVRDFMRRHRCESPYFLRIAEEFLSYLAEQGDARNDPAFLMELAHYEWVELALDIAEDELPESAPFSDVMTASLSVSPLAWSLAYQFPVQHIGRDYQPAEPSAEPSYIVVYRNRQDQVQFLEINAVTARLLALLVDYSVLAGGTLLHKIAQELNAEFAAIADFGRDILVQLLDLDILIVDGRL
ncbi:DUF2063 domain-containing protein [Zhongshania guokunii]|uniref:DUF2063 domain-containing protein n=1 Tax=Zhongshania guokunii TaxID=641783 RepID=A0ABV3U1C7_9GAMM